MNDVKINYRNEILLCAISGLVSLFVLSVYLHLFSIDLNVPFTYGGNAFDGLITAQNLITGNGIFLYPNMGAPGVINLVNSPGILNIHVFWIWILSLFINEAGLLINIYFILTFITISITATVSLRVLKISPLLSIFGGTLFSLLPYHFCKGTNDLFLSAYTIVPLSCILILLIINGEINFNKFINYKGCFLKSITHVFPGKTMFSIFIAIFIALVNPYYMFYSCIGIIFAIFWNFFEERNIQKIISSLTILCLVIITSILLLIPYIISISKGMEPTLASAVWPKNVEIYNLKLSQLILPTIGHRINLFSRIRAYYENNISLFQHVNVSVSLGLFISFGLINSFFIAMKKKCDINNNIYVHSCGVLNVFLLILGSIGGFFSLFIFLIPNIQNFYGLSLFIAFYSLFTICYILDYSFAKIELNIPIKIIIIVLIGILSFFDLVSDKEYYYIKQEPRRYYSDKKFIKEVEEITPSASMIFQLPTVPYAEINSYVPFIHSRSLKWSYKPKSKSTAERWQMITGVSTEKEMLNRLAGIGFKGLYLDSYGYLEKDFKNLKENIIAITNINPIISDDGRFEYYYLEDYLSNIKNNFNEKETMYYMNFENSPYIIISDFDSIYTANNAFGYILKSGWSDIEYWGVWSDGYTVQLEFALFERIDLILHLSLISFPNPVYFSIEVNGKKKGDFSFSEDCLLEIPISRDSFIEEEYCFSVNIQFNIHNPQVPEGVDERELGIGLKNFSLEIN